jgi:ABC-type multidrug transport system fused ATPase/permease subunit
MTLPDSRPNPRPTSKPKLGYQHASWVSKLTYSFVSPLLRLGAQGQLSDDTADEFLPETDTAEVLSNAFETALKSRDEVHSLDSSDYGRVVWRAYAACYKWKALDHLMWCLLEVGVRIGSPLLLRQLVAWFSAVSLANSQSQSQSPAIWKGWMWSALLAAFSYSYVLVHHQTFWRGMRMGMHMRIQAIAAVESKVLRLTGALVSDAVGGRIVNLVSNDVRRFDDACTFWPFLICGPIELLLVLILVGTRLGYVAAVAGVSTLLLLIPSQAMLARSIGSLRASTAEQTDQRVRLTGEAISGILACKMLAWEPFLLDRIRAIRRAETSYIAKTNAIRAANMALSYAITPLCSLITFATARGTGAELTVANVFYALALLSLPKLSMCDFFVHAVEAVSEARVAINRLGEFLAIPENSHGHHISGGDDDVSSENAIVVKESDFYWPSQNQNKQSEKRATLHGLSLTVKRGELVAIVGPVGSGKSSVLNALLGELRPMSLSVPEQEIGPVVGLYGKPVVAYCQQIPWIMSGTVRENITFGLPYDPVAYKAVLDACALRPDLKLMDAGDATEIGERGVSISGGQKARLALARAAYALTASAEPTADIAVLDDPLGAVDPGVGHHLFERCIGPRGIMKGCTRLLVTHQRQYLRFCDRIIVLRDGRIAGQGTFDELRALGVFSEVSDVDGDVRKDFDMAGGMVLDDLDAEERKDEDEVPSLVIDATAAAPAGRQEAEIENPGKEIDLEKTKSSKLRSWLSMKTTKPGTKSMGKSQSSKVGQLTVSEDREQGVVTWRVYAQLLRRMGIPYVVLVATGLLGGQAAYLLSDYWLATWSAQTPAVQHQAKWVWVYAIYAISILLVSIVRAQLFFRRCLAAATSLHDEAASRLFGAPLSFFHTNPTGRVLNRFSKDQGSVDEQLPVVAFDALQALMMVMGAFILLSIVVPFIIPVFIPLGIAFAWVHRRYVTTSRELKRFEAVSRSPLFAAFSATLKGLTTIRAYAAEQRFRADFLSLLTHNGAWWFCWLTTARWVGFRLDLLVAIVLTVAPLLMMAIHDRLSPRLVGLALTQSLYLAGMLQWMVRQSAEVENNMTSAERLVAYTSLEQEEGGKEGFPASIEGKGALSYVDVTAVYRAPLPPVLRDISFELVSGTSCGVVGRTGSGKSSLLLTLFRLIPITAGRILLDGIDTATLPLSVLRRRIAVIPQDPVLFSGTVRSNLDPTGSFEGSQRQSCSDLDMWEALDAAALKTAVAAAGGLDAPVREGGDNFSAGQRQLLCLARALLQKAAILALDEATANVDKETDACVRSALSKIGKSTLLIIAHRMDTIMECDTLLVLDAGRLAEQGAPAQLMDREGGVFARMIKAARRGKS